MNRFHQNLQNDLKDLEFAAAFYEMSADIALLQVPEQARKALNVSENDGVSHRGGVVRILQVEGFWTGPEFA